MDIEGMLSSLSFDDESGSQSSFDCSPIMSSPSSGSQFGYSTCLSQSTCSISQLTTTGAATTSGGRTAIEIPRVKQQGMWKNKSKVSAAVAINSVHGNCSNSNSNSNDLMQNLLLMQLSGGKSASSEWTDTRFIPSRKHSKYAVMLSTAHEVKATKSTKGQFVQNENDYSVAQLYMKHVLNLPSDETGQSSKKKLCFGDLESKNSQNNMYSQLRTGGQSTQSPSIYSPYMQRFNVLTDILENGQSSIKSSGGGVEDMLRSMRMEAGFPGYNESSGSYGSDSNGSSNDCGNGGSSNSGNGMGNSLAKRKAKTYSYTQYKVLDAPGLIDDFYLNLLDWSSKNLMAVGLGSQVYVWNGFNNRVSKICEMNNDQMTQAQLQAGESNKVQAIQWSNSGNLLGVGDSNGVLSIYDQVTSKLVSQMKLHVDRIGSLAWKDDYLVASGSRDKSILCTDIRVSTPNAYRTVQRYTGHMQEVCGLKWSFDSQMLASGGNDNKLFVWSLRTPKHINKFAEHKAGVKAIAWSPHQHGLLVSGGGTADRTIRFWNTSIGKQIECIEANSQVCNLAFSKNENEFVSTHGFQDNDIIVWKYPTLEKIACLTGHTCRVLQLGLSPCSTKIVTGAGDETLRFWDVFKQNPNTPSKNQSRLLDSKFDLR